MSAAAHYRELHTLAGKLPMERALAAIALAHIDAAELIRDAIQDLRPEPGVTVPGATAKAHDTLAILASADASLRFMAREMERGLAMLREADTEVTSG